MEELHACLELHGLWSCCRNAQQMCHMIADFCAIHITCKAAGSLPGHHKVHGSGPWDRLQNPISQVMTPTEKPFLLVFGRTWYQCACTEGKRHDACFLSPSKTLFVLTPSSWASDAPHMCLSCIIECSVPMKTYISQSGTPTPQAWMMSITQLVGEGGQDCHREREVKGDLLKRRWLASVSLSLTTAHSWCLACAYPAFLICSLWPWMWPRL